MIDYMVMEAVALKVKHADEEARKKAEEKAKREQWKSDTSELDNFR